MSQTPDNPEEATKRRRGIYLLPNLFTTAGLFAGFFAIIAAIGGHFENAAIAIFVAMIMDGFDGRVARMTHTESDFGAEYDSMADMVSFGVAPALVVHQWGLSSMGNIGWFAAFVYTAGAALRLARFNTQIGIADKRYFQGLASPAAAALLAGLVWLGTDLGWEGADKRIITFLLTFFAGVLMVSNIRYHSFKQFDLHGKVPFIVMVAMMLLFAVIYLHPPMVLFGGFFLYALSGLILTLWQLHRRRTKRKHEHHASENNPDS
ncbi:CDP-diacylglycerol--serine O-phosphatidyltransferase [Sulfuriflexus sp.]|uniref:CDP-diacylglycerol--serine O-phosphatidyltransferase n=1 Tax=Sulfuriflexus sp. TaxID=2015443 RepID=UPI0028CC8727|nr:CDP-diacylglycerol--serine O-phosphatidyltransferase [Sulfuriflexus sp.]MDT8403607.1 CDP-diacylglycerol--serine O-phosphatidyltransferase [Sulfuriflexus sp.]